MDKIYIKDKTVYMENRENILKKKRAAIINLGCKVNKYESDAMAEKLLREGMELVAPEETADVYIINTCSVTNMAQKKSRQMLRRAKKHNPGAVVIAVGCYVNAEHENLREADFVDIVVGNNLKKDIVSVITEYFMQIEEEKKENITDYYLDIGKTEEYEEMGAIDISVMNHQRAYIKIQDGCNQFCSYCLIPYTRGRVRSRKPENILSEIKKLAMEGIKEFVLTGIHISSYGIDFAGGSVQYDEAMGSVSEQTGGITSLGDLIYEIEQLPDVERIRLGSLEPRIITREFLDRIGKSDKLCPHFHLSLQSACNETLKRMNRKYTVEAFSEKCRMLRDYFDRPAITTDVIVGFPGETEQEFSETLENLKKLNLYEIHVFKYSVRSGTVAEKLPCQIPEEVKNVRSDILLELTHSQKCAYETELSGYVDEVLVEERIEDGKQIEALKKAVLAEEAAGKPKTDTLEGKIGGETKYFTGHTKRYVKVALPAENSLINRIVKVRLL